MRAFLLCFVPLFAAIDPPGLAPVFLSVTASKDRPARRRLVVQAITAAFFIGVAFFLGGLTLLNFLGVTVADMRVAGGGLLFIFAMMDLFMTGKPSVHEDESLGIVPLATPLIVGPAVLSLSLVLVQQHGTFNAVGALVANLAILAAVLWYSDEVLRVVPLNAMRAISKVIDLLLATIGVMMIREGVMTMLSTP